MLNECLSKRKQGTSQWGIHLIKSKKDEGICPGDSSRALDWRLTRLPKLSGSIMLTLRASNLAITHLFVKMEV